MAELDVNDILKVKIYVFVKQRLIWSGIWIVKTLYSDQYMLSVSILRITSSLIGLNESFNRHSENRDTKPVCPGQAQVLYLAC